MIEYEEALARLLENIPKRPEERVAPGDALGLVLTRPVKARLRMPRFDQSAMDGIAVLVDDVAGASAERPATLRLAGEMPAGSRGRRTLRAKTAVKVFTGSPIPRGTEAVVIVERCRFDGDAVHVEEAARTGQNIRRAGEEFERGDVLLEADHEVVPASVGLLALFGVDAVWVRSRPRVGLITMGDELAAPGERLGPHQIHDANAPALAAALESMGLGEVRSWKVDDRPASLRRAMRAALKRCDVVLTAGGASVGDHDHVEDIRRELEVRELFSRVAIKPGKPNVFGVAPGGQLVLSLPGNPVSALVSFHQLVRPALRSMLGKDPETTPAVEARLAVDLRRRPGRREWSRARLQDGPEGWIVTPLRAQGSHMLSGLAEADALLEIPDGVGALDAGDRVRAIPLRWD